MGLSWRGLDGARLQTDRCLRCMAGSIMPLAFAVLAPLLSGFYVVAVDLTGHGKSARRSADASYQIWDDLPEILGILDALGWNYIRSLGHSRGAIIATLLASAYPERVRHLVLLDAVSPQPVEESAFPHANAQGDAG